MSPIIILLMVTLVTPQCWSTPQRRNWTPQAILYLTGAQGQRSVLVRTTREEGETLRLVLYFPFTFVSACCFFEATYNKARDGLASSLSSFLLDLLQRAVIEDGGQPDINPDEQWKNFNFL